MRIVDVDNEIIDRLRESGVSSEMKSLESCTFLSIIEHNNKIIGACGIGGLFNVISLQIHPDYQDKGFGGKLLGAVVSEAKRREYSFIAASRNPENLNAVRLHNFFGIKPVFQIKYSSRFTRDVIILELNKRGKLVGGFLRIFNTVLGMTILVCCLKIFRKMLFRSVLTYPPEEFPSPDVSYAIKNFKKI